MSLSLMLGILVADLTNTHSVTTAAAQAGCGAGRAVSEATIIGNRIQATNVIVNGAATRAAFVGSVRVVESLIYQCNNGVYPGTDVNGVYPGTDVNGVYPGTDVNGVYPGTDANGVYPGTDVNGVYPGTDVMGVYPGTDVNGVYPGTDVNGVYPGTDATGVYPGTDVMGGVVEGDNVRVVDGVITGTNLRVVGTVVRGHAIGRLRSGRP